MVNSEEIWRNERGEKFFLKKKVGILCSQVDRSIYI